MKFIKENWLTLILIGLVVIVILQRNQGSVTTPSTITIRDTTIYIHDSTVYTSPTLIKEVRDTTEIIEYIPSDNYEVLLAQFEELKEEYLKTRIYLDSAKFDSSKVTVIDTVKENKLLGRSVKLDLKVPTITINNYIPTKPGYKVFLGGQILYGAQLPPQANLNILLKDKKDIIYGAGIGINGEGSVLFNVQTYWKIKIW